MILPTGIKKFTQAGTSRKSSGFTFVEVMVTLAVLSVGIIMIYRSFLISLDQINYLTRRVYATVTLDNLISELERTLKVSKALPIGFDDTLEVDLGDKKLEFNQQINIAQNEELKNLFKVECVLSWKERNRPITLSRPAYISNALLEAAAK